MGLGYAFLGMLCLSATLFFKHIISGTPTSTTRNFLVLCAVLSPATFMHFGSDILRLDVITMSLLFIAVLFVLRNKVFMAGLLAALALLVHEAYLLWAIPTLVACILLQTNRDTPHQLTFQPAATSEIISPSRLNHDFDPRIRSPSKRLCTNSKRRLLALPSNHHYSPPIRHALYLSTKSLGFKSTGQSTPHTQELHKTQNPSTTSSPYSCAVDLPSFFFLNSTTMHSVHRPRTDLAAFHSGHRFLSMASTHHHERLYFIFYQPLSSA